MAKFIRTKWIVRFCILIFLVFLGNLWYQDYQNMHETIQKTGIN